MRRVRYIKYVSSPSTDYTPHGGYLLIGNFEPKLPLHFPSSWSSPGHSNNAWRANVTSSAVDLDIAAYYVLLRQKVALAATAQHGASNSST